MASNLPNRTQGADGILLERLCAEIEVAWQRRRDPTEVDRLAREHPNLAAELYDFFASLMDTELDPGTESEGCGPDPRVRRWLEERGYALALRAAQEECQETTTSATSTAAAAAGSHTGVPAAAGGAPTPDNVVPIRSYVRLLHVRKGATPVEVSRRTDTPLEFIMFAQQNQEPRYDRLRGEIVGRGVDAYGIDYEEGSRAIRQRVQEAAFAGTTTTRAASFEELVARARLTRAKKKHWLSLVEGEDS